MVELQEIIGDYEPFLNEILEEVDEKGFDVNDFAQIDHLCYRTTSLKNYNDKKSELDSVANLVGETMVNGRLISTYRLIEPIYYDIWRIDGIELPAPKTGSEYEEGLEHIEFVIYDDIPTFLARYSNMSFELKAAERGINPEIGLNLDTYTVKFHLLSLLTVAYLEKKLEITSVSD